MRLPLRAGAAVLIGSVLLSLAACDREAGAPGTATSAPPPTSAQPGGQPTGTAPAPPGTTATAGPATGPTWTSSRVTVKRVPSVPPIPVLTGLRWSAHSSEGYDRMVFDFRGPLPGYDVQYVSEVRADGSGELVKVPGRRYLLIVFEPAQAHEDNGTATVRGSRTLDLPMLRGYAVAGDFEAVVSIALGLDDVVGFRVGELPGRIYVDVAA